MPRRIMIVDDSLIIRDKLRDILEGGGYQVVGEAENYEQAIRIFHETKPDLVTLDIVIGQPDGIEVLKTLRSLDKNCLIVMVTALQQARLVKQAIDYGANNYLVKPFNKERVLGLLERAFEGRPEISNPPTLTPPPEPVLERLVDQDVQTLADSFRAEADFARRQLERWSSEPLSLDFVDFKLLQLGGPMEALLSSTEDVAGFSCSLTGDFQGATLVTFSLNSAHQLAQLITNKPFKNLQDPLNPLEVSALSETVNIVVSSFLNAFSSRLMIGSVADQPRYLFDGEGPMLDTCIQEISIESNQVMLTTVHFVSSSQRFQSQFYFLPSVRSVKLIVERMRTTQPMN